MKARAKKYRFPLYVNKEVYDFMISSSGVGSETELFKGAFHDPTERHPAYEFTLVAWYPRKKDVIRKLIWLIDWYHAAAKRQDGKCCFPNWDLICEL